MKLWIAAMPPKNAATPVKSSPIAAYASLFPMAKGLLAPGAFEKRERTLNFGFGPRPIAADCLSWLISLAAKKRTPTVAF